MPRARISKQDILKAAARVIHQRGEHALSVRSIAAELGCSTQPLYSQFGSQEQLQQALDTALDPASNSIKVIVKP